MRQRSASLRFFAVDSQIQAWPQFSSKQDKQSQSYCQVLHRCRGQPSRSGPQSSREPLSEWPHQSTCQDVHANEVKAPWLSNWNQTGWARVWKAWGFLVLKTGVSTKIACSDVVAFVSEPSPLSQRWKIDWHDTRIGRPRGCNRRGCQEVQGIAANGQLL